jgi:hypothetical protein
MLGGQQIAKFKGKIIGRRILDAEGPTMETCLLFTGSIMGTPATEMETVVGIPTSPGVIHSEGQGVLMSGDSEMATYTGEAIGKVTPSGMKVRGAIFFRAVLSGKLEFLSSIVGVFESEIDAGGNVNQKIWEWK